jgi:hypothetical protein
MVGRGNRAKEEGNVGDVECCEKRREMDICWKMVLGWRQRKS